MFLNIGIAILLLMQAPLSTSKLTERPQSPTEAPTTAHLPTGSVPELPSTPPVTTSSDPTAPTTAQFPTSAVPETTNAPTTATTPSPSTTTPTTTTSTTTSTTTTTTTTTTLPSCETVLNMDPQYPGIYDLLRYAEDAKHRLNLISTGNEIEPDVKYALKSISVVGAFLANFIKCDVEVMKSGHSWGALLVRTALTGDRERKTLTKMQQMFQDGFTLMRDNMVNSSSAQISNFLKFMEERNLLENEIKNVSAYSLSELKRREDEFDRKDMDYFVSWSVTEVFAMSLMRQFYYGLKNGTVNELANNNEIVEVRKKYDEVENYLGDTDARAREVAENATNKGGTSAEIANRIIKELDEKVYWKKWHVIVSLDLGVRGYTGNYIYFKANGHAVALLAEYDSGSYIDNNKIQPLYKELNDMFKAINYKNLIPNVLELMIKMAEHVDTRRFDFGISGFYCVVSDHDRGLWQLKTSSFEVFHDHSYRADNIAEAELYRSCYELGCDQMIRIRLYFVI